MKSSCSLLLTLCCVLLFTNTVFPADEKLPIGSIGTAGNVSISRDKILSEVRSRVGQQFDETIAAEDAERIAKLAGVEYSYYNTVVVDGKIQLTFVVAERSIVRSIDFRGNRKFTSKKLRSKLAFKRTDYLEPVMAEAGRTAIAEYYKKNGFAFAKVSLDTRGLSAGRVIYTIDEGPRVKIAAVEFSGNSALKTLSLKGTVKTKKRKLFLLPSYYSEEAVSKDVTRLQNIYYKKGFMDVKVTAKQEFTEDRSKVRITFVIEEGRIYTVDKIVIAGNAQIETGRLRSKLKLEEGQVYNKQQATADVSEILKLYREEGFIDAKVGQEVKFISDEKINVEIKIAEGGRFRIGRINISGNEKTQDKAVRQVLSEYDFAPGQWYNADIARGDGSGELEKEVRRRMVAESATITPRGESVGQRDADVGVIEGQTGMVMLGAGVSSDSGAIGQLIVEQRNFDIRDWPKNFKEFITGQAFRGAGQTFKIALQPGTEVSEYMVSFSEPYFQNKPISFDLGGSSWIRWRESYDESRLKGYTGFEKRYKNRWRRSIVLRVENVNIKDIDYDAPSEIVSVKGDNMLIGVTLGAGRDLTDDRYNPSKGYSFNFGYEQVAGDHTFGILSGAYRRYQVISEDLAERKTVLATKLLAATTVGDAPPFEKFYGGGTGTFGIRGFDYRGVSTRGGVDKDPIGSDWILIAGAEATVPLSSETLAALFFVDSGMVDSGGFRVSLGTGIQILIPQWFGPVPMRLEIAAPLMKDEDDDKQVLSFSVGRLF